MGHGNRQQVISYLVLRRAIGILGVVFPVWLSAWCRVREDCDGLEDSISAYYHTASRDWFVGILFAIGIFFWAYRGPDGRRSLDNLLGNLACYFALGVALLPTNSETEWIGVAHAVCAACLFLVLSAFSLFLFTRKAPHPTPRKLVRNNVFRICGYAMLACVALIGLYNLLGKPDGLARFKPVFWLEALALWAFGISWLTKGEMLWPDQQPHEHPTLSDTLDAPEV